MLGIDVLVGKQGIAGDPVEEGSLRGAAGDFIHALVPDRACPGICLAVAEMSPAGVGVVLVAAAVFQGEDLLRGAGSIGGRRSEFALILVIHEDGDPQQIDGLGAGPPGEVGMS